jgi:hypothetical protein
LKKQEAFNDTDYHQPSDQYDPSWDFSGGVNDMRLLAQLGGASRSSRDAEVQRRRSVRRGEEEMWRETSEQFVTLEESKPPASASVDRELHAVSGGPEPRARCPESACCLKCENLQPMGAFKIRGAFNMISQLPKDNLGAA